MTEVKPLFVGYEFFKSFAPFSFYSLILQPVMADKYDWQIIANAIYRQNSRIGINKPEIIMTIKYCNLCNFTIRNHKAGCYVAWSSRLSQMSGAPHFFGSLVGCNDHTIKCWKVLQTLSGHRSIIKIDINHQLAWRYKTCKIATHRCKSRWIASIVPIKIGYW